MTGYGLSAPEQAYDHAMNAAAASLNPRVAREWLEAAEIARRLMEFERLAQLGRSAEALR